MKKIIIAAILTLIWPNLCLAENRNFIEFSQVYMNQIDSYTPWSDGTYYEYDPLEMKSKLIASEGNAIEVSCMGGKATIDMNTGEIVKLQMKPIKYTSDGNTYSDWKFRNIAALSALEFGADQKEDEDVQTDTFFQAQDIYNQFFIGYSGVSHIDGRPVLVYQGNYDYYFDTDYYDMFFYALPSGTPVSDNNYNDENGGNISSDAIVDVEIPTDTDHVSETHGTANLVSAEDFMYYFNFYGALFDDGHVLSIDNANEFVKVGEGILYKTIFNDCEILSLMLSSDAAQVKSIHCTWAYYTSGANDYLNDFLQMLMESLLACGMESDSISSLFSDFGKANAFSVGDKGERTIDGIKVSYEVTSYGGVSFVIERE